jgi:hypothetical protein
MIVVQKLNENTEFVEIGRVKDGEIIEGKEALTAIDDEEVWTTWSWRRLEMRFNGPIVVASRVHLVDDPVDDVESS